MTAINSRAGTLLAFASFAAIAAAQGRFFAEGPPVSVAEKIAANRDRQEELLALCEEIQSIADAEKRELTKEEDADIAAHMREYDKLGRDSDRRLALADRTKDLLEPNGRKTSPTGDPNDPDFKPSNGTAARDLGTLAERSKTFGFKSQGDFCRAVAQYSKTRGATFDERLKAAAAGTISSEGAGADGGFAVPPEYRNAILERVFGEESLLGRADPISIAGSQISFPTDMTTPWDAAASGGIQAYWEGETGAYTQSKVKLEKVTTELAKLTALVPVSDELLEDAPALGGYIQRKAPEKMDFKVSWALAWGNGAGMPLGFMNAPALVTQAAEGAQTTDTINATNVAKMFARMPANLRNNAIWLIHPDAEPQLMLMTIGNQPVYIPPGGLSGRPYGILLGRPVIPHEICETVGDLGDIMFVDMTSYLAVKKSSGLKSQTSIHLWFDQDLVAFKFTLRIGGQPWWSAPISPRDGSSTRSPFVTLASR